MNVIRIKGSVAGGVAVVALAVASVAYACGPTRNFFVTPDAGKGGPVVASGFFDCDSAGAAVTTCPGPTGDLLRSKTPVVIGYQYDLCGIAVQRSVKPTGQELNPVYAADGCKPVNGNQPGSDAPIIPEDTPDADTDVGEPCPNKLDEPTDDNLCTHLATYILRHSSAQECGPLATSADIGDVTYVTGAGEGVLAGHGTMPAVNTTATPPIHPGAYEICVGLTGAIGITPEDSASIGAASATAYNLYGYYVLF